MSDSIHVDQKKYGCAIMLHHQPYYSSDAKCILRWDMLPFSTYVKFKWYFRYRAALIQVKHPRQFVEMREYQTNLSASESERINRKNKIIAAKAMITKIQNKIDEFKFKHVPTIFEPKFEDTIAYKKAMDKLESTELKLQRLYSENC